MLRIRYDYLLINKSELLSKSFTSYCLQCYRGKVPSFRDLIVVLEDDNSTFYGFYFLSDFVENKPIKKML